MTIAHYQAQFKRTVQVSVEYDAKISATIEVPDDWTNEEIIEELKDGYYEFAHTITDEPYVKLKKMTELIVNGVEVKLKK